MTDSALIDAARILDGNPVPCFVIDETHVVVYWNEALARLSGIPAANVLGTHDHWRAFYPWPRPIMADLVLDNMPADMLDKFYAGKYRPLAFCPGGWEAEDFFPTFGQSGRWLAFSAAPIRGSDGRIVGCVETLQDITERKQAELARNETEQQRAEIIDNSPVATFVVDIGGRVTHWNRACAALTGCTAKDMIGRDEIWRAFYPDKTRRVVLAQMLIRNASIEELDHHYVGHAQASALVPGAFEARDFFPSFGEQGTWLQFMAAPLHDLKGNVVGAIETLIDLGPQEPQKEAPKAPSAH